jgi:hypothetical protein
MALKEFDDGFQVRLEKDDKKATDYLLCLSVRPHGTTRLPLDEFQYEFRFFLVRWGGGGINKNVEKI